MIAISSDARRAFSLIELSIVLVILGLLTGGILAGQSLIRAAELRSVSNELMRYKTAIGTFRDKYFALPGDMLNAQSFWGSAGAVCPAVFNTYTTGNTCNGDGDGQISAVEVSANEVFRFWSHLALAGLIEGNYTGVSSAGAYSTFGSVVNQNIPSSKLSPGGWSMLYIGVIATTPTTNYFEGSYGNAFLFGIPSSTTQSTAAIIKPEEAWNIDTKLDDGKPATGAVTSFETQGALASTTSCSDLAAATTTLTASNYSLANTGSYCSLVINSGY